MPLVANDAEKFRANIANSVGLPSRAGCEAEAPPVPPGRLARCSTIVWLFQLVVPTLALPLAWRRLHEPYPADRLALLLIIFCLLWCGGCFLVLATRVGRRWVASHPAQLIGLYVSVTLSLAAAEGICRMFDSTDRQGVFGVRFMDYSPILGWKLIAGVDDIGGHGWRGASVSHQKSDRHCRIVCVGDSTTFGYLCSWEEAWPHQLEIALNQDADWVRDNGTTEVLNLGVSGYGPDQSLLALKEFGLAYSPDIVIFHLCLNDFADVTGDRSVTPGGFTRYKPFYVLKEGHLVLARDRVPLPRDPEGNAYDPANPERSARGSRVFRSALWHVVRKQAQNLLTGAWRKREADVSHPQYWPIHDSFRATYATTRPLVWAMIKEMSRAANEAGAVFLVTLSPANMKFVNRPEDAPPWRVATFLREYESDARAAGVPALDCVQEYFAAGGNERFLIQEDGYHLNPKGNAFVARATASWLAKEYQAAKLRRIVP